MSEKPTPGQAHLLRYAVQQGGAFGPLGADLRSYDACLRRGWLVEEPVERPLLGTPGVLARITDAGLVALAEVTR